MFAISVNQSICHFSSNLPHPPRSRVPQGPGVASGGQPLVSSSSPVVVPIPAAALNTLPNMADSLVPIPSQGHSVNKDLVTLVEPFESTPQVDKGKQPANEGLQRKRK